MVFIKEKYQSIKFTKSIHYFSHLPSYFNPFFQYLYLLLYFETLAKVDLLSKLILLLFINSNSCSSFSLFICFTFSICWILSKILFVECVVIFFPKLGNCVLSFAVVELASVLLPIVKIFGFVDFLRTKSWLLTLYSDWASSFFYVKSAPDPVYSIVLCYLGM